MFFFVVIFSSFFCKPEIVSTQFTQETKTYVHFGLFTVRKTGYFEGRTREPPIVNGVYCNQEGCLIGGEGMMSQVRGGVTENAYSKGHAGQILNYAGKNFRIGYIIIIINS